MKPSQDVYDSIPPLTREDYAKGFIHIPGVYCAGCGETFALYSFSACQPGRVDENGKPFYRSCFKCESPDPHAATASASS